LSLDIPASCMMLKARASHLLLLLAMSKVTHAARTGRQRHASSVCDVMLALLIDTIHKKQTTTAVHAIVTHQLGRSQHG